MTQRTLLVLSFDLDGSDPEVLGQQVADVVKLIHPPRLPGFTGELRVSVEPVSRQVETWLDDGVMPPAEPAPAPGPAHRKPFPPAANRAERRHPHR